MVEQRRLQLTQAALKELPEDVNTFESVGKCFLRQPKSQLEDKMASSLETTQQKLRVCDMTLDYLDKEEKEADQNFLETIRAIQTRA